MRYRNIVTGYEFETPSQVSAPNYVLVGAEPASITVSEDPAEIKEPDKEEAKKAVTKKRPAKKGAKK